MTDRPPDRRFHRRAVLGLITLGGSGALAFAAGANKFTVRDVVTMLVNAPNGQPPDLSHRDLSDLDLAGLDFKRTDLTGSNLFGADLTASNLDSANLSRAVLDRATLVRTQ
jgi:uncharacterized protein YjbI with pentapeptide repeats